MLPLKKSRQLEVKIERADLFTPIGYLTLGLGFAIDIAAYRSSSKTGSARPGSD